MPMKNFLFLLLSAVPFLSCNSSVGKIFRKRTPHEAYAEKIEKDPAGKKWLEISRSVLQSAQPVSIPYSQLGYFPVDRPRALALSFTAKQGEQVNFDLIKKDDADFVIYADVFQQDMTESTHLLSADTLNSNFSFIATQTGKYILRLQPELNRTGEYNLSVTTSASLGFPVAGNKARVGSIWGDSRDGGKRSHEGIDIFAAKRTPVIAAADGYISRVDNGGLGGKTVSLRVYETGHSLYYAHLDEQLVREGQRVKKGDTLGLVGNTGNAKHTPSHLHFGIYADGVPVDPLPFVNNITKQSPAIEAKKISGQLLVTRGIKNHTNEIVKTQTLLQPLAISTAGYIAELPDGSLIQAPTKSVRIINALSKEEELAK